MEAWKGKIHENIYIYEIAKQISTTNFEGNLVSVAAQPKTDMNSSD
jgi:hypothetical protein